MSMRFSEFMYALGKFHKMFDVTMNGKPTAPSEDDRKLRFNLIYEELHEYLEAALGESPDLVETADALGDILYVLLGSFVTWGIDPEPIFWEIHRSNMTKMWTYWEWQDAVDSGRAEREVLIAEGKESTPESRERDSTIRLFAVKRPDGKAIKSPSYEPPNLKPLLEAMA